MNTPDPAALTRLRALFAPEQARALAAAGFDVTGWVVVLPSRVVAVKAS